MRKLQSGNYVHYGCGINAPAEWLNFDVSPTLRIQKTPIINYFLKNKLNTNFPENVRFGNIIKGLPIPDNSCKGIYCSHVLEHLTLDDCRKAIKNSYKLLKKNGVFRCVVPDLEYITRKYLNNIDNGNHNSASIDFINETLLGTKEKRKGLVMFLTSIFGNSKHLWMWDKHSLSKELRDIGFSKIRNCNYNDSKDKMFSKVENRERFKNAVAIEAIK